MGTVEPGSPRTGRQPGHTGERRLAGWQRGLRWTLWVALLAAAVHNSQSARFSGLEWLLVIAAIGFSIWCLATPLGGPKVDLTEPAHVLGTFVSRTSWGLLLLGTLLTVGGVAGAGAAGYDLATGRAEIGDVLRDVAYFVAGWVVELITGGGYDAELENTHAYALFLLLVPGLILLWCNMIPLLHRGSEFRAEGDGSVLVRRGDAWEPLLEYQYATVTADGTAITFTPPADGPPAVVLPQARVFCRENGARLGATLSAAFFRTLLARRGFEVSPDPTGTSGTQGSHFTARRT